MTHKIPSMCTAGLCTAVPPFQKLQQNPAGFNSNSMTNMSDSTCISYGHWGMVKVKASPDN